MNIVILGGTGFIGSALVRALSERGDTLSVSSYEPYIPHSIHSRVTYITWDGTSTEPLYKILNGADAIVNLVGANIASKRWTKSWKRRIVDSRIQAGTAIVSVLERLNNVPSIFIQASASGYYGFWTDQYSAPMCTENFPPGEGFLAQTTIQWEASTEPLEKLGIRRCIIRTAPVIGAHGGFLEKMLPSFLLGLGSIFGSGMQPFPWIHLMDEVRAITFLLDNASLHGVFNVVSPEQSTMREFAQALGHVLKRPVIIRIPSVILQLLFGEMAKELLLAGQRIYPQSLLENGFSFSYVTLKQALQDILTNHI